MLACLLQFACATCVGGGGLSLFQKEKKLFGLVRRYKGKKVHYQLKNILQ